MKITFLLLACISILSFGDDKLKGELKETKENYLIVGTPEMVGFDDNFIQLQAGKISVNVLAKSRKFLLMFTAQGVAGNDVKFKRLVMTITKKSNVYDLKIAINKVGDKESELKSVSAKDIEKRFLLLQIRKSMYELIFGKDYLKKMQKTLEKENEKDKKELTGLIKKGLGPQKVANSLAQIISDIKLSKLKLKNQKKIYEKEKNKKELAEKNLDNFKSNIHSAIQAEKRKEEIKDGTDREFRGKEKPKKQEMASSDKKDPAQQKDPLESSGGSFGNNAYSDNIFNKDKRPRGTRLLFEAMTLNRSSTTNYILKNVQNDFFLYGLRGSARVEVFPGLGDDFVFSFMYLKKSGNDGITIPDIKNFHLLYLSTMGFLPFDLNIGFHLENQYFINILEDDGLGPRVFENQYAWLQVGIERTFKIWKIMIIPQFSFSKNVYSDSSAGDEIKLDATKIEFGGELGYKNYRVGAKVMQDEVTSVNLVGFKTQQTSTFFTMSYVFM